jgi:hypothetical protein
MADEWTCPDNLADLRFHAQARAAYWLLVGTILGAVLAWLASQLSTPR